MVQNVQTAIIPTEEDLDPDVIDTLRSLQCFKDRPKLVQSLLNKRHNTEKVIYFLLLDRKLRNPALAEEEYEMKAKQQGCLDPPKKRIDSRQLFIHGKPNLSFGSLAEGSPLVPRRALTVHQVARKASLSSTEDLSSSQHGVPTQAPATVQVPRRHMSVPDKMSLASERGISMSQEDVTMKFTHGSRDASAASNVLVPLQPNGPATTQAQQLAHLIPPTPAKPSVMGTPRFHRRRFQVPAEQEMDMAPSESNNAGSKSAGLSGSDSSTLEPPRKSWFGALVGYERDEQHHFVMIRDRPLDKIKADVIHALLNTPDITHSIVGPYSFRGEYRRTIGAYAMFSRNVKFQIDIRPVRPQTSGQQHNSSAIYCVDFSLVSGPSRRFKRLCEHFQALLLNPRSLQAMRMQPVHDPSSTSITTVTTHHPRPSHAVTNGTNGSSSNVKKEPATPSVSDASVSSVTTPKTVPTPTTTTKTITPINSVTPRQHKVTVSSSTVSVDRTLMSQQHMGQQQKLGSATSTTSMIVPSPRQQHVLSQKQAQFQPISPAPQRPASSASTHQNDQILQQRRGSQPSNKQQTPSAPSTPEPQTPRRLSWLFSSGRKLLASRSSTDATAAKQ